MADPKPAQKEDKTTKVRRKPERESVLTPTLTSLRAEVNTAPGRASAGSVLARLQPNLIVNQPGDSYEQEADRVADTVMRMEAAADYGSGGGIQRVFDATRTFHPELARASDQGSAAVTQVSTTLEAGVNQLQGRGDPLPEVERSFFEARMGYDFSQVRLHTDPHAIQLSRDLQAQAFTIGNHIAFNQGRYQPGTADGRHLLAHELTHVLQQAGGARRKLLQRAIDPTYTTTNGDFNVTATAGGSNLPITIRFMPNVTAPYSNQIGMIQIVKLTNATGGNVEPASMPTARAPSLRTTANATTGAEAGYFTDVYHQTNTPAAGGVETPAGSALPPQYAYGSGAPNPATPTPGMSRPYSAGYPTPTIGYKRSNDPADIRAAEIVDAPGYPTVSPANPDLNFEFETVAKGEDTMTIYGALKWGFEIRSGVTQNEHGSVSEGQSATFNAALGLHRDFYVHEPVIFYFDFNSRTLSPAEAAKIDTFLDYLRRFPEVQVTSTGYADMRGGASEYNMNLSLERAQAVNAAMSAKGVPASQLSGVTVGSGATSEFTSDATTTPQEEEANRRGNRRVVVTFERTGGGGGGGGAPAGGGGGGTP